MQCDQWGIYSRYAPVNHRCGAWCFPRGRRSDRHPTSSLSSLLSLQLPAPHCKFQPQTPLSSPSMASRAAEWSFQAYPCWPEGRYPVDLGSFWSQSQIRSWSASYECPTSDPFRTQALSSWRILDRSSTLGRSVFERSYFWLPNWVQGCRECANRFWTTGLFYASWVPPLTVLLVEPVKIILINLTAPSTSWSTEDLLGDFVASISPPLHFPLSSLHQRRPSPSTPPCSVGATCAEQPLRY